MTVAFRINDCVETGIKNKVLRESKILFHGGTILNVAFRKDSGWFYSDRGF